MTLRICGKVLSTEIIGQKFKLANKVLHTVDSVPLYL